MAPFLDDTVYRDQFRSCARRGILYRGCLRPPRTIQRRLRVFSELVFLGSQSGGGDTELFLLECRSRENVLLVQRSVPKG